MGLDIYVKKAKRPSTMTNNEFKQLGFENAGNVADSDNKKALLRELLKIRRTLPDTESYEFAESYKKKVKKLFKYCSYPEFTLRKLGITYDYNEGKYIIAPTDAIYGDDIVNDILKDAYAPSIAYFRKVNFIYRYFDDRGKLDHNEECAWVDTDDIDDIIEKCEQVLAERDEEFSKETLPTQPGFFFGSLDYDKWYYGDVKDCLKQFKKIRRGLKEDEVAFIVFSW